MGSENRQKTATTTIRLTSDERCGLIVAASRVGLGPSSFARNATLRAIGISPRNQRRRDALATDLAPVLVALSRIGNNLNQIARVANATRNVPALTGMASIQAGIERLTIAVLALRDPPA